MYTEPTRTFDLRSGNVHYYDLGPGNAGMGSNTNESTRAFANNGTPAPQQVAMSWAGGGASGATEFLNPPPAPGQSWDAGHILGRQSGGSGVHNSNIFPQNPQINRGNSLNGQPTYDLWRRPENDINAQIRAGQNVGMSVNLRNQPRPTYSSSAQYDPAYWGHWGQ
jgi:hypothetical protein